MTLLLWLASSTGAVADDYPVNPGDCQDSWVCIFSPTIGGTITGPYSLCPGKTGSWSISDTVTPGRKERCEMPKYPGVLNANGDKGKIDWVWKIEGVNSFTADGVGSSFDKSYSEPGEYKITWKGSAYTDDKGESEKCDNPYDVEVTFSFTVNSSTPTAALTSIVIKSDLVCAEESDGISIIGDQSQCDPGSYTVKWKIESDGGSQNLQFTPSSGEVSLTFMQSANITFKVKAGAGAKAGTAQIKITATVNGVDQTMSGAVTVNDPKPKANLSSIFTMPDSICLDEESDGICIISDGSQCDPGAYTVKWKIESDGGSQNLQFTPSSGEVSLTFMQSVNITFKVKAGAGAKAGTATYKLTATVNGVDQTMNGQVTVDDSTATATLSDVRICVPDEQGIMPLEITNTGKCKTTYTWLAYVADGDREVQITPATGTVTLDPQEKSKNLSLTLSYAGKKLIATTIRVDVDTATTSGVANATAIAIGKGLPNDGEAKFDDDLTCLDLPPEGGAAQRIPFTVHHSIITNDTPEARELKGNLSLRVMGGTPASFKIYHGNALYVWGSDIPVVEYGHSGCGRHDFHTGDETFFVEVIGAGMLELEAKVVPVEEKPYGQGAATKKDSIKMFTKEPKKIAVDVVHSSVGVCIGEEFFFPIKLTNNGDCPVTVNLTATKIAGNLLLENNTLEASIQLPPHGEPQVKHLSGKVLDISPPGTAKLHLKVMLGNETIYQTDAGNHLTVFTNSEPNQGVADLPEGARDCLPVNVATDPTKPLSPEISFTINRGIVTTNSLPTRQLNGKLSLSVVSGDQNAVRLFHKGEPYTWGSPIAFSELGGSCGQVENMGTETFSAVGLAPGLIEIEAKVIPDPDQFGAGGSLRTARLKLHAFDLQPYVGAAGNVLETTLLGDIKIEKFSKNGNYVRFLAVDGSTDITVSKADYDQAIQAAEAGGALPDWSGQIVITKQRRSDKSLKLTLLIGDRVSVGWHDALIEGCERLKEYSGGDEAFRVKEALAVVNIAHETASEQTVATQKKSFSAPVLMASVGSTNVTGKQVTVSFSGTVQDKYAGLVQSSALKSVHVFRESEHVGDIALSVQSQSPTDFAPFAKQFTYSGSVTMDAWVGTYQLVIITDANEMGASGRIEVPVTLSGVQPITDLVAQVTINTGVPLTATTINTITLTSPNVQAGGVAQNVTLTETGIDTRTFTAAGGWEVSIAEPVAGKAFASVSLNESLRYAGDFTQTSTTVFTRADAWTPEFSGSTTVAYVVSWPAAWSTNPALTVTLPTIYGATGPITLASAGMVGGLRTWSGTWTSNAIKVQALDANRLSLSLNENIVASLNTSSSTGAGSASKSYTISDPYEVAAYNHESTGAVVNGNNSSGNGSWEPYRIRVDFPQELEDKFITDRTWEISGNQVEVKKHNDKWYVTNAEGGKPSVYVNPAVTPSNPPVATTPGTPTTSDPPLPDGWLCYRGEQNDVQVVAYQWWGKEAPQTVEVRIHWNSEQSTVPDYNRVRVIGAPLYYQQVSVSVVGDVGNHPLFQSITCTLQKEQNQGVLTSGTGSSINTVIRSGLLREYATGPACWIWKNSVDGPQGWQWLGSEKGLKDIPSIWTLPDRDGSDEETVTLQTAVAQALGESDMPEPSDNYDNEVKRFALCHLVVGVASGPMARFDLPVMEKWYQWIRTKVFEKKDGKPVIKKEFLTYAALDLNKVQEDLFKNDPGIKAAYENMENERKKYGEWTLGGQPFTEAGGWVAVLTAAGNLNPISAAICYAAGEPILPKAETATWCAAGIAGGYLIIDRLPFSKLGLLFKRKGALPGETKPVRKLTKEEMVIPGFRVKDIVERDANDINKSFMSKVPPQKAPYIPNTKVTEFTTAEPVTLVRFHGPPNQKGDWFAYIPEAKGWVNAEDIRQKLCLKRAPTHYSIVEVPAGIRIRKGGVRKQEEWGCPNDGGTQFQLILGDSERDLIRYVEKQTIENWR
jgi:hypothetical protein